MVSIVIPTLNEENYLPRLLKSLRNQTFDNFEVIIADAGSTDKTKSIGEEFGAKIVEGGIPGIGRNNGADAAQGEIIIFIDSDVYFENDFLENSLKEFKEKNFDFAIPYFYENSPKKRFNIFFQFANNYKRIMERTRFPDGTGQLMFIYREKFIELGKFKKHLKVAEDTDLFWRASKKFKVGTIHQKFYSSTRRLEKVGILWTFFVWGMMGVAMSIGIMEREKVQNFFTKLYGGYKGFWKL